jgi:membrane protease YdiL (CAAX protease family)
VTLSLGLLNGWYFYKTRNLLSCIIIHSLNNFISITLIKYFVDKMHSQVITVDTQIIQFDNVLLFIFLSLSLIIVGFYLFKSVILDPSNEQFNTKKQTIIL